MELNFNILKVWISVSNLYTGGCSSVSWIQSFVSSVDFVSYLWTNCWAGNISINEQIPLSEPYKTYTTLWIIERAAQNSLQLHTQLDTWYFLASHVYLLLGLPDVFCLVSELIDTREYIFLHFSSSLFMITWNVWFFSDILTTYLDKLHVMLILNLSIWVFFSVISHPVYGCKWIRYQNSVSQLYVIDFWFWQPFLSHRYQTLTTEVYIL